jgi:alpha-D-ribose 1-methylphosphonate 5-triphosphate synthase subunit PhnG
MTVSHVAEGLDAPWGQQPWLDPLEDFQCLENAPEVEHAQAVADPDAAGVLPMARASIAFTDGTPPIVAMGEGRVINEARRHAARNALIVLATQAPDLADSLQRRQAKNAKKRRHRAAARERRAQRAAATADDVAVT